jgi:general secretion pathway protein H
MREQFQPEAGWLISVHTEPKVWPKATRHQTMAGFTLIETLVVLVILGLALSIVAGFLPRRNSTLELAAASQRVVSTLRLARGRAIAESRPVTVTATRDGHGVAVDGVAQAVAAVVVISMTGPAVIRFAPDGSASGGGIRVQGAKRAELVGVNWLTGRISVTDAL